MKEFSPSKKETAKKLKKQKKGTRDNLSALTYALGNRNIENKWWK